MYSVQVQKIQIGTIHDINGARFWNQMIKNIDIVNLTVSDPNESWDIATQIQ